jgi:predicted ATPase
LDQVLNLADRAEDGPLSPAEASRLRAGIRRLEESRRNYDSARRASIARLSMARRRHRDQSAQLTAIRALVANARHRGARSVPVWILSATLDAVPEVRDEIA